MAHIDSHYLFVEVAAKRCKQLIRGAKPNLDLDVKKPTTLAIEEVRRGLIDYEFVEETEGEVEEDGGDSGAEAEEVAAEDSE